MDPLNGPGPWTGSMDRVHENMDWVHGPPIFTTPKITDYKKNKIRPVPNAVPLMCRTNLHVNTVRLWSDFGATSDSDGVLAYLPREGHGKQFLMRIYAF